MKAAGQLFGAQRFHEVRMEDIAAEAAVGKGTLYRYFSDKEELYLALLARASEQFVDRVEEAMSRDSAPRRASKPSFGPVLPFLMNIPICST